MMRLVLAGFAAIGLAAPATAQVRLEVEAGASFQSRNTVRIPGDTGTRFDMNRLQGAPSSPVVRVTLDWQVAERNGLRASYQYLRSEGTGQLPGATRFQNTVFAAGTATRGNYQFDTWRVTYRYRLLHTENTSLHVGGTVLVRNAEIRLRQGAVSDRRGDVGVVPLIHVAGEWRVTPQLRLMAEVDALGAPAGYAVDAALRGAYAINRNWEVTASYRFLDGGADNRRVFNFASFHSLTAGLAYRF
ncbi:MAG: hypothetical protein NTW56_03255 [Alphaproteobacteria bacterium]|nr:hypothetical protein [Alphaproteobacteria bacterium]